jgi:hypothetical protein
MDTGTTFRITLVGELTSLVNSHELGERSVQMDYVEDKKDVLSEFLDYYTDSLFEYEAFSREFTVLEIEELRKFIRHLRDAIGGKITWGEIRSETSSVLSHLKP